MNPLRDTSTATAWREALTLFDRCLALSEAQCEAELARIRQTRPAVHARLMAMIQADADPRVRRWLTGNALQQMLGAAEGAPTPLDHSLAGQTLGPWILERPIGSGGMGQVWLARRNDGLYHGEVAIKMLREPAASVAANERFAREGQMLARLSHPNIARLLDAGFTANGQRYLVLEYVDGEGIDRYCDAHLLDVGARIRLFLQVCAAVVHAHANLVVHRDLKPSNVLVMRDGNVKLLDFGVAKLIESDSGVGEQTQLTQVIGAALTPEYAAPEQIDGGVITTAADVYSLGVLLYSLLCGRGPYGPERLSPAQLVRRIVETEPARLSADTDGKGVEIPGAQIAAARSTTPARLTRALRGDLDNIVARALKKQPAERYASVQALSDDLTRHLNFEPVSARPDRLGYRAGKFVRRHWIGVGASAALIVAIAAGVAGVAWQARIALEQGESARRQSTIAQEQAALAREHEARARGEAARATTEEAHAREQALIAERFRATAEREAKTAQMQQARALRQSELAQAEASKATAVKDYLVDVFRTNTRKQGNPEKARQTTVRELLDVGAARIKGKFEDQPDVRQELLGVLEALHYELGEAQTAQKLSEERMAVLKQLHGDSDPRIVKAYLSLYANYYDGVNLVEAKKALAEATRILDRLGDHHSALRGQILLNEARLLQSVDPVKTAQMARRADEIFATAPEVTLDNRRLTKVVIGHAELYTEQLSRALDAYRQSLDLALQIDGAEGYFTGTSTAFLGEAQFYQMHVEGAERSLRRALELSLVNLGEGHWETHRIRWRLGLLLHDSDRREDGLRLMRTALDQVIGLGRGNAGPTGGMHGGIGHALLNQGQFAEAEAELDAWVKVSGAMSPVYPKPTRASLSLIEKSRLLTALGRNAEAVELAQLALVIYARIPGTMLPAAADAHAALAESYLAVGRLGEAQAALQSAERIPGPTGLYFPLPRLQRELLGAELSLQQGDAKAAQLRYAGVVHAVEGHNEARFHGSLLAQALLGQGRATLALGDPANATKVLERSLQLRTPLDASASPWLGQTRIALAESLLASGEMPRARQLIGQAKAAYAQHPSLGRQFTEPLLLAEQKLR